MGSFKGFSAAILAFLLTALLSFPANADDGVAASHDGAREVEGEVVVVMGESYPEQLNPETGEVIPAFKIDGRADLLTVDGEIIELADDDDHDFSPGQQLTVTLDDDDHVLEVAERIDEDAQLDGVDGAAESRVAGGLYTDDFAPAKMAPREHTIDVVYCLRDSNDTRQVTDSEIENMIASLSDYWKRESGGQISGIRINEKRLNVESPVDGSGEIVCKDFNKSFEHGAQEFGHADESFYVPKYGKDSAHHLLVLASFGCDDSSIVPSGVAHIGYTVHSGGIIWVKRGVNYGSEISGDYPVLAHEFGHNISMVHAADMRCPNNAIDGEINGNCTVVPYNDLYDLMGFSNFFDGDGLGTTPAPLGAVHREYLGSYNSSQIVELRTAGSSVNKKTVSLRPSVKIKNGADKLAYKIIDPSNGNAYYFEYRSGTEEEKQSYFNQWFDNPIIYRDHNNLDQWGEPSKVQAEKNINLMPGVRVLRGFHTVHQQGDQQNDSYSTVLYRNATKAEQAKMQDPTGVLNDWSQNGKQLPYYTPGTVFKPYSNSFEVKVLSMDPVAGAQLEITFWPNKPAKPADPKPKPKPKPAAKPALKSYRLAGADRFETSVAVSKHGFPGATDVVYVATGMNFPDALAAAPAAAVQGGPLLLLPTNATAIPKSMREQLKTMDPKQIVVVGGKAVVSDAVVNELKKSAPKANVKRLSGADRYATGREIVKHAFPDAGAVKEVYIATGANYPDALSASAAAGSKGFPVILVNGSAGSVDAQTLNLIKQLKPEKVWIAGGTGVVSTGIESQLKKSFKVERLGGADRYATSALINEKSFGDMKNVYYATGTGFADALSGAAVAGKQGAPLFVVQPGCVPVKTHGFLKSRKTENVYLVGGEGVLNKNVKNLNACK